MGSASTPVIQWKPQKTSAQGDFVARAFLRLLSRGSDDHVLSEPELLVRETAQNSWDARRVKGGPVSMEFSVRTVAKNGSERRALEEFFDGFLGSASHRRLRIECLETLRNELRKDKLTLLYVSDLGTHGLGGPTDASIAVDRKGTDRYVKFLLNIGDANTDTTAGGAYGLGRSVFWRMSECSTAIVYSRSEVDGRLESRLIGLSLSENFALSGKNHTGRHWWTSRSEGQPVLNGAADRWAKMLGFTPFTGTETGTVVLVVAPFAPRGPVDLAKAIARSIEYHLWPKYVSVGSRRSSPMRFSVRLEGEPIPVRDRAGLARTPLSHYINCFERALAESDREARSDQGIIRSAPISYAFRRTAHPNSLGCLVATVFADASSVDEPEGEGLEAPVAAALSGLGDSVALLRTPELVVTYRPVEPSGEPDTKIAGVFKSSDAANEYFRASETSTHSEWDAKVIGAGDGIVIRKFHDQLVSQIKAWYPPAKADVAPSAVGRLAIEKISEHLGGWLTDRVPGEGIVGDPPDNDGSDGSGGGGGDGGRRRRSVVSIDDPVLAVDGGVAVNEWTLSVSHRGPFTLKLQVREAGEDGRSLRVPPIGPGARPALRLVMADETFKQGGTVHSGSRLRFPSGQRVANTVSCELDFDPTETSGVIAVVVHVLCDQGTVPVLGADVVDKPIVRSGGQ